MTTPDTPSFESEVQAMLHRRAGDVRPDGLGTDLPDADAPLYHAGLPSQPAGRRHAVLAAACIVVLLGLGALVAGAAGTPKQAVQADQATTTETTTAEDDADGRADEPPTATESDADDVSTAGSADADADQGTSGSPDASRDAAPPAGPSGPGGSGSPTAPGSEAPQGGEDLETPSSTEPATVTLVKGGTRKGRMARRDCEGNVDVMQGVEWLTFQRTGPIAQALTVPITFGGSLTGSLFRPLPQVDFRAGYAVERIPFSLGGQGSGDITVALSSGPGYTAGSPSSVSYQFASAPMIGDCLSEIALPAAAQTIDVGQRPQDLVVPTSPSPSTVIDSLPFKVSRMYVQGTPPPGLGLTVTRNVDVKEATWSGTATTPGTYRFPIRYCSTPNPGGDDPWAGTPDPWSCFGTSWITIVVREP